MIHKYKFFYVCNSLTKGETFRSIWDIFTGKKRKRSIEFKQLTADYLEVQNDQVFLFGSGRMGLYTILKTIDVEENDEVIVAGYTCVVVTNAIKFAGCKVVYCDIQEDTLNLNTTRLIQLITEKTKAIVVPHNFGITYEDISLIKSKFPKLLLIEDAAHTFTSVDGHGNKCGTLGDVAFFSMEFSKPITTGIGGIFVVNNRAYLKDFDEAYTNLPVVKSLKVFKILLTLTAFSLSYFKRTNFFFLGTFFVLKYLRLLHATGQDEIDGKMPENYAVKLSESQAVFGYYQIKKIQEVNQYKLKLARRYENEFESIKQLKSYFNERYQQVRFPLVFSDDVSLETIAKIRKEAQQKGFAMGEWFNDVVHPIGSYRHCYIAGSCETGESISKRIINLPLNINVQLKDSELDALKQIFNRNGIV